MLNFISRNFFVIAIVSFCLLLSTSFVDGEVIIPKITSHVTDNSNLLSIDQKASIEQNLADYEKNSGSQVLVVIIDSLGGYDIEQYSLKLVSEFGLGRKNIDDGVLLLISKQDKRMRIEVGKGLEGAIPDVLAGRIVKDILAPSFKEGRFYEGIQEALKYILSYISKEPLPLPYPK